MKVSKVPTMNESQMMCDCKRIIYKSNRSTHLRSALHRKRMELLNEKILPEGEADPKYVTCSCLRQVTLNKIAYHLKSRLHQKRVRQIKFEEEYRHQAGLVSKRFEDISKCLSDIEDDDVLTGSLFYQMVNLICYSLRDYVKENDKMETIRCLCGDEEVPLEETDRHKRTQFHVFKMRQSIGLDKFDMIHDRAYQLWINLNEAVYRLVNDPDIQDYIGKKVSKNLYNGLIKTWNIIDEEIEPIK